jgi:tRNA-binding protein
MKHFQGKDFWIDGKSRYCEKFQQMDLTWSEFERVEMRVGTIVEANDFPEARKPAYQLTIDFGSEIGIRKSSAQITKRYAKQDLIGRQIVGVVNFPRKQIEKFMSECLVIGSVGDDNDIVLLAPDFNVENGLRIG